MSGQLPGWWFLYPGGAMALPPYLARAWRRLGRRVAFGTYADVTAPTLNVSITIDAAPLMRGLDAVAAGLSNLQQQETTNGVHA